MKMRNRMQRLLGIALALALLASMTLVTASGLAVVDQEMLTNGDFEGGFTYAPGCGMVGTGWGCFTNGGMVDYGFYDDQWEPVVADGAHSQLIELSTMQYAASEADRYAGIYQTVKLVKGQSYQLKLSGLMREKAPDPNEDAYRYRVQWGYTSDSSTDWTKVSNWAELPWDKIDDRTSPTGLQSFSTKFTAPSDQITLFIRIWKKWGTPYKELNVDLDAISLFGPAVKPPVVPAGPVVVLPGPVVTLPPPAACGGPSYIANGGFEGGFVGGVGKGWTAFNNDGGASYGFYDEMWPKVIKDGTHGQLIEINTLGLAASDPDRYAGIYQVVDGLTKDATYEFSLYGMMRERYNHSDEDMYRYRVQWGYVAADADPNQADITNWAELPWDDIYLRTAPGDMSFYSVKLTAPSSKIVIAIRAWKKWGTAQRELDVNLDAITLVSCPPPPCPECPTSCIHTVAKGETLAMIAAQYGTTVAALAEKNHLTNPNILLVGQQLSVPCDGGSEAPPEPQPVACVWHTVVAGDTLYGLAVQYNTTVASIMEHNHLANPNLIYIGQKLCIVDP